MKNKVANENNSTTLDKNKTVDNRDIKNIKVILWQDVVSIRDLIISIFIGVVITMGLFFFAPADNHSLKLLLGLIGSIVALIINSIIFKPKRKIEVED